MMPTPATGATDGAGAAPPPLPGALTRSRTTRVVLAAAHLDYDPAHNHPRNLKSLCQRCHMLHDRPHHLAQRWVAGAHGGNVRRVSVPCPLRPPWKPPTMTNRASLAFHPASL